MAAALRRRLSLALAVRPARCRLRKGVFRLTPGFVRARLGLPEPWEGVDTQQGPHDSPLWDKRPLQRRRLGADS
jgi:hypothetical protein